MESISLSATISAAAAGASTAAQFCFPSSSISLHPRRSRKFCVLASKGGPSELDGWEKMELKFGRMIGEDPKLTIAKMMARKANPEMTPLEVEKLLERKRNERSKKGKIEEVPPDLEWERKVVSSVGGINLVRPVTRKGVNFETNEKPAEVQDMKPTKPSGKVVKNSPRNVPNVILRKPTSYKDDSDDSSRFGFRPNLSLQMMKDKQKDRFSDMTLLKKPEPLNVAESEEDSSHLGDSQAKVSDMTLLQKPKPPSDAAESSDSEAEGLSSLPISSQTTISDMSLSKKPEPLSYSAESEVKSSLSGYSKTDVSIMSLSKKPESVSTGADSESKSSRLDESETNASFSISQNVQKIEEPLSSTLAGEPNPETKSELSEPVPSIDAALLGRPKRLDPPVKATSENSKEQMIPDDSERNEKLIELDKNLPSSVKDLEARDWKKAEEMALSGEKEEVEIVGSSSRGFTVSFHSLIGILPYRNLTSKWKFLAFESWLRKYGIDPSKYRKSLGVISTSDTAGVIPSSDLLFEPKDDKLDIQISPDMKLEDFLKIYDQQKLKFLSSFVGQKIRVIVVSADKNSKRLIFSTKPRETDEMVEKKRSLMAKLSVGDVVSCCIKKITYFGVFVEVEGVPALIHQTEVSWDATLDPASFFKVGQIVEAKVHQLDFSLERIFLSLKEITRDPLIEALDAVVGGHDSPDARFKEAQADTEWAEVESLMKELEQVEAIQSVSKGRYFVSPGLAPTFQVYMASIFENQYKLLARSGNRAQEVIVETSSLDKEEMRIIIQTCTNKVQ